MKSNKGYLKLSKVDIYEKDFEVEYKGYKVEEVDSFLDIVYEDYKYFEESEGKYLKKLKELEDKNKKLIKEIEEKGALLKHSEEELEKLTRSGVNNSAIIKRISNLEKDKYNK
ncbi:DivIVA domain-containing protein [Spiroplasma litorale]|uniref:DivIVA domain-containing protein n=1 Tax=Spiroplasma litorale TaxID=216942 RepID=A0A0K1W2W6_9MOLU|nr:DivIVA domain-containing protein [Spiroplasma litorale]AKX34432.1 DivIVA domain-containing protein [Spiroplasma litorale]